MRYAAADPLRSYTRAQSQTRMTAKREGLLLLPSANAWEIFEPNIDHTQTLLRARASSRCERSICALRCCRSTALLHPRAKPNTKDYYCYQDEIVLEIFEPECEGLLSTSPQVAVNLSPAKFRRALPREVQKV